MMLTGESALMFQAGVVGWLINNLFRVSDEEAVAMSRYLVQHDGLFLGSSSACNLIACVRLAKTMSRGSRIVTIL